MSFRETLAERPVLVVPIAVLVLAAAVGYIAYNLFGSGGQATLHERMAYFYDENTGELFLAPVNSPNPLETESGPYHGRPAGVKAHVFACQSCNDPDDRYIGWLEIPLSGLSPEETKGLTLRTASGNKAEGDWPLFRLAEEEGRWVAASSGAATKIMDDALYRCDGGARANRCRPQPREIE